MSDISYVCPFDKGRCDFPNGAHFEDADFIGCKVVDVNGVVRWICPRFPSKMSITAVREAFMRLRFGEEHERKRMRRG